MNFATLVQNANNKVSATAGWYIAVGCLGGIMLANTPASPYVFSVLSIAILYQISSILTNKQPAP